jgi:hypothetical protein
MQGRAARASIVPHGARASGPQRAARARLDPSLHTYSSSHATGRDGRMQCAPTAPRNDDGFEIGVFPKLLTAE